MLGNRRHSLTAIRSLHRAGWTIIAAKNLRDDRDNFAWRSVRVAATWTHDGYDRDDYAFGDRLLSFLEQQPDVTAVFPIDEAAILQIHALRMRLPRHVHPVLANPQAVDTCLDKAAMLRACDHAGVPYEPFEVADGPAVAAVAERLGLPCVVKPYDAETLHFGIKAAIFRHPQDLTELAARPDMADRRVIVQRFARGPRLNVYFSAWQGTLVDACFVTVLRGDRVDDTGLAVSGQTVAPDPEVLADVRALLAHLNYSGVGTAQFLVDDTRESRAFIELNPRLGGNFAIAEKAGLSLAVPALDMATGKPPENPARPLGYARGHRLAWTFGALAGARFEWRQGVIGLPRFLLDLARTLIEALRADVHITWSWRDPAPTLLEFRRALLGNPRER